jgi:glucose-fructose oxidoreductase
MGPTAVGPHPRKWAVQMPEKKVRYAVVGLGHIAQAAVLPGFQHARTKSQLNR